MKIKHKLTVYVAVWTKKGADPDEWEGDSNAPKQYEPLESIELSKPLMFYYVKEKRNVYVMPVAVFADKAAGDKWLEDFGGGDSFEIRKAELSIL